MITTTQNINIWGKGKLGIFLVGGGGSGGSGSFWRANKGGSSGFFKYKVIDLSDDSKISVSIEIGQGGSGSFYANGKSTTLSADSLQTITADGGGKNGGKGWSMGGGGDWIRGSFNGAGANGSGDILPNLCQNLQISPGNGGDGTSKGGGGGGGVVINGKKPLGQSSTGEGYGAGGNTLSNGSPGAALIMTC